MKYFFFFLDVSLHFVEWLHALCIDNLVPGACYQRRKICLEILAILYETFQYNEKAKQRKSFTPGKNIYMYMTKTKTRT